MCIQSGTHDKSPMGRSPILLEDDVWLHVLHLWDNKFRWVCVSDFVSINHATHCAFCCGVAIFLVACHCRRVLHLVAIKPTNKKLSEFFFLMPFTACYYLIFSFFGKFSKL